MPPQIRATPEKIRKAETFQKFSFQKNFGRRPPCSLKVLGLQKPNTHGFDPRTEIYFQNFFIRYQKSILLVVSTAQKQEKNVFWSKKFSTIFFFFRRGIRLSSR